MEREKLHRFFEGEATAEERKAVKHWLEQSDKHREELFKEREFFDALILSDDKRMAALATPQKRNRLRTVLFEIGKVAAMIIILFMVGNYYYNLKLETISAATHTVVVPAGQRANIQLPDGTNVWLNARSEISYPAYFNGDTREIELKGEAYFEVKHNREQPFIVHTHRYDIEVLGTTFNVEAYADSPDFSAALMEGAVAVTNREDRQKRIKLIPNQKVSVRDGELVADLINDYDIYRWREGLICFKDTGFKELMTRFEKCYGIAIVVENPNMADKVFSGKFRISDGIDSALRVLQKDGKYTFERDSDDSVIYIR